MNPLFCQFCGRSFVPKADSNTCPHCQQPVSSPNSPPNDESANPTHSRKALTITNPRATLEVPDSFRNPLTAIGPRKTLPLDSLTIREQSLPDGQASIPGQPTLVEAPPASRHDVLDPTLINPNSASEAAEHFTSRLQTLIPPRTISRDQINDQIQDYKIEDQLGHGAYGVVFRAVQVPLDRTVAVKILQDITGDSEARNLKRKNEFLREAQFTSRLEHPNIVPIHDIGLTANPQGKINPFYAMKEIRGVSWQDTIESKSRQENLQILKHVINAIRFAHDKSIIHCDLKPDNVMLGEFGEVLIVDWGQAIDLSDESTMRPGGTPAYISPEMARYWCDLYLDRKPDSTAREQVGFRSDVYLLGALLFEIVTGSAPHLSNADESPYDVIRKASTNYLTNFQSHRSDELMRIALSALRADGFEPIETVGALSAALNDYETQRLSIELRERAFELLESAITHSDYDAFQRARFGFEESLEKWHKNKGAIQGLQKSRLRCAQLALQDQNFELGIGMLEDPETPEEHSLREQLLKGKASRDRRKMLVRLLVIGLITSLIVGVGFNAYMIQENIEAGENRDQALEEKATAEEELSRLRQLIEQTRNQIGSDIPAVPKPSD